MTAKKKSKKIPVPETLFNEEAPAKRKPGRPKKAAAASQEPAKRRPGRPKGSKNKAAAEASGEAPKRRPGRPRKNPASEAEVQAAPVKRRGRPKKAAYANGSVTVNGSPSVVLTFNTDATLGEVTDFLKSLKDSKFVKSVNGQIFGN